MWSVERAPLHEGDERGPLRVVVAHAGASASFEDVLHGWRSDDALRSAFGEALAAAPFEAFFWELPPLRAGHLDDPFECVLVDSPGLARVQPEPGVFADVFRDADADGMATFWNLGGDALLVAPCASVDTAASAHLASFLRTAPAARRLALWRAVGDAVAGQLGERPLWVSTSGAGVYWLHVRLDARPKYYTHAPYRVAP